MYEKILEFSKQTLECCGAESETNGYPYRKRSEHIRRVFLWAERLTENTLQLNRKVVLTAAALHDIGYSSGLAGDGHARAGALLAREYLEYQKYPHNFTDQVCFLIEHHSSKELLGKPDTPLELTLLMEADLLDETGALSILWDCMDEGGRQDQSFEKTVEHIRKYSAAILNRNPMVTPKAREFWHRKQELVTEFISQCIFDLGLRAEPCLDRPI